MGSTVWCCCYRGVVAGAIAIAKGWDKEKDEGFLEDQSFLPLQKKLKPPVKEGGAWVPPYAFKGKKSFGHFSCERLQEGRRGGFLLMLKPVPRTTRHVRSVKPGYFPMLCGKARQQGIILGKRP